MRDGEPAGRKRLAVAALCTAAILSAALVLLLAGGNGSDAPPASRSAPDVPEGDRDARLFGFGTAARMPGVGRLEWECNDDSTRVHSRLGSHVTMDYAAFRGPAGQTIRLKRRQGSYEAPPQRLGTHEWRTRVRAKPGTQTFRVSVTYAATPKGRDCHVVRSALISRLKPNSP